MKNIDKYEREISQLVNEGNALECSIATVAGIRKEKPCYHHECEECHKKCIEWMYSEYKEEILYDDEKDIIKEMLDVILKLGCEVNYVIKYGGGCDNEAYIWVNYKSEINGYYGRMTTPLFKKNKFKGMEYDRKYTLEELGL